ncbi:MAG: hypothetical protein SFV18_01780 [Bryobacteraceae bacterium]|nr:hypothetical protein [Bryobacteraceae bacterium]
MRSWTIVAVLAVRTLSGQPVTVQGPQASVSVEELAARKAEIRASLAAKQAAKARIEAAALNKKIPDDPEVWMLLGESQLALGKLDDSEKSAQWMLDLKIGKADPEGWLFVAKIREAHKDYVGAMEAVTRAFEMTPVEKGADRAGILRFAARLAAKQGDVSGAARYRSEAIKAERR